MTTATDIADARTTALFRATLGRWLYPVDPGHAPLGLHWCLFPPLTPTEALRADGHPPRTHQVDEAAFPRRMWIGGEVTFAAPLPLGRSVERQSNERPVEMKDGRSGRMAITGIDHYWSLDGVPLLTERQDIAYRTAATGPADRLPLASPWEAHGDLVWEVAISSTLLFRYSAITFNSHRIHYDASYARDEEGYSSPLVHGPLQATILLNLVATLLGHPPSNIRYRSSAPAYAGDALLAVAKRHGNELRCSMYLPSGQSAMSLFATT